MAQSLGGHKMDHVENNSSLLEILTQYEVLISYRNKLLDLDPTVTRVGLYRDWINGEISSVMLNIQNFVGR